VLLLTMQSPQTFLNVYEHSPLPPSQTFGTQQLSVMHFSIRHNSKD
jgi:hypothetical protein